ncbi:MAG TPA: metallophosphoesterase [Daejeonella sp.]
MKYINRRKFVLSTTTLLASLPWGNILAADKKYKPMRFGILTDIHYAELTPRANRYYHEALSKTVECVEFMNQQKVEFLLENGDLKDQGKTVEETLRFLDTIESELQKFNGPLYHVLGNHDADNISKTQFLSRIKNTGFSKPSAHYSFDRGSWHFIALDANYTSKGVSYDSGNFDWTDCHVPADQLEWLKKDLNKNNKPTIVFIHQQLDDISYPIEHRVHCPNNSAEVRTILEASGNVPLVFQGHYHNGGFNTINGINYYTLSSIVEGTGSQANSFAVVEIDETLNIQIKGYQKAVSKYLPKKQVY